MSLDTPNQDILDLTSLLKKEETINILPPALLAAKALNKKNTIGTIEVELPVINVKVKCNALSNIDDLTIKTISGSMSAYNDLNIRLLYNHLIFPENCPIQSYEIFLYYCTEADFRAGLYGVMMATFKNLDESRFKCKNKNCPNPDTDKIFNYAPKMSDIRINYKKAPYASPNGDHTKDIFIATSEIMTVNYKFENLLSKIKLFESKSNDEIRNNLLNFGTMVSKTEITINYIDSIKVIGETEEFIISRPEDIKLFINSLNLTSKEEFEKLNDKFIEHISSWNPTFNSTIECPHCKSTQEWEDIDIYVEFFRKFTTIFQ